MNIKEVEMDNQLISMNCRMIYTSFQNLWYQTEPAWRPASDPLQSLDCLILVLQEMDIFGMELNCR